MSTDKTITPSKAKEENEAPKAETGKSTESVAKPEAKKKQPKDKKKAETKEESGKETKKVEKKDDEEDKVVEEKSLTINLRHAYLTYGRKAAPKAVRLVKKTSCKVFHTDDVKIDDSLNQILWSRGKTKTERKVAVKVQKLESGTVRVRPSEA